MVNALARRHSLLAMLETKLLGFESLKDLHVGDDDFKEVYEFCANLANGGFFRHEGFLFKEKVKKKHESDIMGHFEIHKTYETLHEKFYWPHMKRYVHHICQRCLVYKLAKSKVSPHGLYTRLPIPTSPWVDISMGFVLGLPKSNGGRDGSG
ncbi:hypothetical protein CR513_33921, partial [Mucuna pruriens]